ncbi:hypothetical protein PDG61_20815 [Mycolicibacterium sp. BiH015]|uniref:hypothetical protein n=1 Tax=Mycolicibacterium sp. BiH015 TaxID=3018808 RepID=UPI0022E017BE|nr:hypothetical protein [Mycolicibacterium sp. BiH015]MDA2893369.1 hypothetical protein [Mycolicibacterium sp. BiH015]
MTGTGAESASRDTGGQYHAPPTEPASTVVTAWADHYIQFENEPEWQKRLRKIITTRCARLLPSADEVLHATFYGDKPPRTDIENLVLYNLHHSFSQAGRYGIRFEHGLDTPASPDGQQYRVGYRYALAAREGSYTQWQLGRTVASFGWTDLGEFPRKMVLAQVLAGDCSPPQRSARTTSRGGDTVRRSSEYPATTSRLTWPEC